MEEPLVGFSICFEDVETEVEGGIEGLRPAPRAVVEETQLQPRSPDTAEASSPSPTGPAVRGRIPAHPCGHG